MLEGALFCATEFANDLKENPHGLNKEDVSAIHLYTQEGPFYPMLNRCLRHSDRVRLRPFFPYLKLLLSGPHKLPLHSGTYWRGVNKDLTLNYPESSKVIWWAFSSSTRTVKRCEQFLDSTKTYRTLFSIESRTGVDISPYSAVKDENEVLLMPGSYFNVNSVLRQDNFCIVSLKEIAAPPLLDFPHPAVKLAFKA